MSRLEKAVHAQFAAQPSPRAQEAASSSGSSRQAETTQADTPLAKVNSVVPSSPAAEAGLLPQDKIARFGSATWLNHDKLAKVAQIVGQSEGVSDDTSARGTSTTNPNVQRQIPVTVVRGTDVLQLSLTPRSNWGGRGMLGCHLVPL